MVEKMTEEELIRQAKREYMAKYRKENREELLRKQREWRKSNPEKVKQYHRNHWLKKAKKTQ